MGNFVFKLPDIGEGVVEGEVVQWHVSVGDQVSEDDPIVDVMTDKATVTIPSPVDGVVSSLSGGVGDMIGVGTTLLEIDSGDAQEARTDEAPEPEETVGDPPEPIPATEPAPAPVPEPTPPSKAVPTGSLNRVLASPAVRRRAREGGVDLANVRGSGPAGRIRHADLDAFMAAGGTVSGAAPASYSTKRTEVTPVKVVG